MKVKIKLKTPECLPMRGTEQAAGYDLKYCGDKPIIIYPHGMKPIPTGVFLEMPSGYEAQVRPRSGLMFNHQVIGMFGTIDSDYRGEIKALLFNASSAPFAINPFDRISQLVFAKHESPELTIFESLEDSERGENGFGHTGTN